MSQLTLLDSDLAELGIALECSGLGDVWGCFAPHTVRPDAWIQVAQQVDGMLRASMGLLLFHESVPVDSLPGPLAGRIPALIAAGVCEQVGETVQVPTLILVRTHGLWLFVHPPQMSPTLYFGDDSLALAHRLAPRGRCLDLCAGPGVQALLCATCAGPVVAAEINPVAAALCRVNVALNGLSDRVSVRCGDLYDCADGEVFDTVTANPPLLPIPSGLPYPFVGDGGPDGLRVVRRILARLPAHLAPGGQAKLIGMTLSDGLLPLVLVELETWAKANGFDATMTVTGHASAGLDAPWVRGVAATVAAHAHKDYSRVRAALAEGYAALEATHVCAYALSLRRGPGSLRYIDVSAAGESWAWFV